MKRVVLFLTLLPGCTESAPNPDPISTDAWFVDEATERGVDFVWQSGFDGFPLNPEITSGGVAMLDVDNDGDVDIFFNQGGSLVSDEQKMPNRLYLNDGEGFFVDASESSGVGGTSFGTGVSTGDYDNDGDVDIYLTNVEENVLLQNDGTGFFTDVTETAGVGESRWSASSSFFDMDNDGDLDLYIANYIDWTPETEMVCKTKSGQFDYCHPQSYRAPAKDTLYKNNGDGTFVDVSESSGIRAVWGNGLGVVVGDVNTDSLLDVFVANDEMNNQLWLNQGDGTFIDDAIVSGVAVDSNGEPKAGMGTDFADVNNDDLLDLIVVNLSGETDSLFLNEGGWFSDGTSKSGLSSSTRRYTRFGTGFRDLNNDGELDLYMANGKVQIPDTYQASDPYAEQNVLLQGIGGGRFEEVLPKGGTLEELIHVSRGCAFGDLNGDGALDIVVVNRDSQAYVLMNQNPDSTNSISLLLLNSFGAPAQHAVVRYELNGQQMRREVQSGGGYCSANSPTLIIGLGSSSEISNVVITWPDGSTEHIGKISAGANETVQQR